VHTSGASMTTVSSVRVPTIPRMIVFINRSMSLLVHPRQQSFELRRCAVLNHSTRVRMAKSRNEVNRKEIGTTIRLAVWSNPPNSAVLADCAVSQRPPRYRRSDNSQTAKARRPYVGGTFRKGRPAPKLSRARRTRRRARLTCCPGPHSQGASYPRAAACCRPLSRRPGASE
jgi:hypothetical protein